MVNIVSESLRFIDEMHAWNMTRKGYVTLIQRQNVSLKEQNEKTRGQEYIL
jgi:hypothetical protein